MSVELSLVLWAHYSSKDERFLHGKIANKVVLLCKIEEKFSLNTFASLNGLHSISN